METTKLKFSKFRFFSKTIKGLIKLITKKKFSIVEIGENIFFFLEILIGKILFRSFRCMIRGKRTFLTLDDFKNSIPNPTETEINLSGTNLYTKYNNCNFLSKKIKKIDHLNKKKKKKKYPIFLEEWTKIIRSENLLKKKRNKRKTDIPEKKNSFKRFLTNRFFSFSFSLLNLKQRIFYQYLISVLQKGTKEEEEACLESLARDQGLLPMVPYLLIYMNHSILDQSRFISKTILKIRMIKSLFLNHSFKFDPFIHQILIILIKHTIGNFYSNPSKEVLFLRLYSVNMIGFIIHRFGQKYIDLEPKLTFYFSRRIVNLGEDFSVIHGALMGLSVLGNKTIELHVLPHLPIFFERLANELKKKFLGFETISNLTNLYNFLVNMLTAYLLDKTFYFLWYDQSYVPDTKIDTIFKLFPMMKRIKASLNNCQ